MAGKVSTGITSDPPLRSLAKELRAVDRTLPKRLAAVNKEAASIVADDSRDRAQGEGGAEARMAGAIKAAATTGAVAINVSDTAGYPYALAAFLGAKGRFGWYADDRYADSEGRQFPEWVGASWEPGGSGGPEPIQDAIRNNLDRVLAMHGDAVDDLLTEIFGEARHSAGL